MLGGVRPEGRAPARSRIDAQSRVSSLPGQGSAVGMRCGPPRAKSHAFVRLALEGAAFTAASRRDQDRQDPRAPFAAERLALGEGPTDIANDLLRPVS